MSKITPLDVNKALVPEESKVGKKLSDLTTRRVILLVLAMLFSVPLFSTSTYLDSFNSYTFGLNLVSQYDIGTEGFNEAFKYFIQTEAQLNTPIILVSAKNITWEIGIKPDSLRTNEQDIGTIDTSGDYVVIHDLRSQTKL